MCLRLKLQLKFCDEQIENPSIVKEKKLWFFLNTNQIKSIAEFRNEMRKRLNLSDQMSMKLLIDNFEILSFESTSVFREGDVVSYAFSILLLFKFSLILIFLLNAISSVHLLNEAETTRKRKLNESTSSIEKAATLNKKANLTSNDDYEMCLIGTSMVRNIQPNKIFPNKKCFFKSISGGRINDIVNYLKFNESWLTNCKLFLITCGSNDCDSFKSINEVIQDYLNLAQYLSHKYPVSRLLFNKLVPRTKTRYTNLIDFEKRRLCFNGFLENALPLLLPCTIISHEEFESSSSSLEELLCDGVHLSLSKGVSVYTQKLKQVLKQHSF